MRFMMVYLPADVASAESGAPPTPQEMAAMGAFIGKMAQEGVLIHADGLMPSSRGARVRQDSSKVTVTDGPFTETKEMIAGFAIVEARSKDHAIDLARQFLAVAGDGTAEVRQMHDQPAFQR